MAPVAGSAIVVNTSEEDVSMIRWLFDQAMLLQGKNGYRVWDSIDPVVLERDIEKKLQYKIADEKNILCIFSIQFTDPFIWRERDQNDAIYLHRIVVHPAYRGQRQFEKVVHWAIQFARKKGLKYVRMDTWAENTKIIRYYQSFGFVLVETFTTPDTLELPVQNRNLNVALLELRIPDGR